MEEALVLEAQVLLQTDLPIAQIAGQIGIQDPTYFSRLFKKVTGQSPGQWRTGVQQAHLLS
ncbi:MAG: helix-turn-helix domain-containing protein [Janthinobacterium lividum]